MQRPPFSALALSLGSAIIALILTACLPMAGSGSSGGGDDEENMMRPGEQAPERGSNTEMGDPRSPSDDNRPMEMGPGNGSGGAMAEPGDNGAGEEPGPGDPPMMDGGDPQDPGNGDPGNGDPGNGDPNNGDPGNAPGTLGAACAGNADCDSGVCVTEMPGGYCTQVCQNSDDCGPAGSCWNLGQPNQLCLRNCEDNADCREDDGYVCDGDDTCFPSGNAGGGDGGNMGMGPGAAVGEIVNDFSLTNCGTGEQVNVRDHFGGQRAGLFVLTAGWCGACAQYVPQILELLANPQAAGLEVAFVLGENRSSGQPSLRECQQYGAGHGIPPAKLFMDHDGADAFRTVFANLRVYTDARGAFGLPWNALVNPANWEYIYADGGPGGDLNAALGRLLQ